MLLVNNLVGFGVGRGDPFTKLLLHCDGADGSTTFTDHGFTGHAVTANGNAQIDTAQSKFGGASALFDGTGDYLTLDGSSDFAFGAGDFTIDFWMRANKAGSVIIWDHRPASTEGIYPTIYLSGASNTLVYYTNSANRITGSNLSLNTWYHVAVARSGTSTKMFLDGTQVGSTYSDSNNYLNPASRPVLGASGYDLAAGYGGWIDELRVSKGIARWTANFTPPTQPYPSN